MLSGITSKQLNLGQLLWEQYKFSCCILYIITIKVVLFFEVQNLLKLYGNQLSGTWKSVLCRDYVPI